MPSIFGGAVASSVADKVKSGVNVVGKPVSGESGSDSLYDEINWHDYNYPPCCNLIHYDLEELPASMRRKVQHMNLNFVICFFAMMLNLLNTFIFAVGTKAPGAWFFLSIVHAFVLSVVSLFIFYHGYRGLSIGNKSMRRQYMQMQALMAILYFVIFLIGSGPINGMLKIAKIPLYTITIGGYWLTMIIIESTAWILNAILALVTIFHVATFDDNERLNSKTVTIEVI